MDDQKEWDADKLNEIAELMGYVFLSEGANFGEQIMEAFPEIATKYAQEFTRICALTAHGELVPLCRPIGECQDNMVFDAAMCKAGVKVFIRPTITSDMPGSGTPINPDIKCPPTPELAPGNWLAVIEIKEGFRIKRSVVIAQLVKSGGDGPLWQ